MSTSKSNYYIKGPELAKEVIKFLDTCKWDENGKYIEGSGRVSEELGKMIFKICKGLGSKPSFSGYTYLDDMMAEGALTVIKYLKNFDRNRADSAFSYITQIVYNSFRLYIKKQKVHSKIKNILYENQNHFNCFDDDCAINYTEIREIDQYVKDEE